MLLAILNMNLARFFNIGFVSWCVNSTRSHNSRITNKQMFVMWIAGLRGAMAYALALDCNNKVSEGGGQILIVTLIYALFTILGISSILHPVMNKCEVTNNHIGQSPKTKEDRSHKKNCPRRMKDAFSRFDKYVFSPLFIKDEERIEKRNEGAKIEFKDDQDWKNNSINRSQSEVLRDNLIVKKDEKKAKVTKNEI